MRGGSEPDISSLLGAYLDGELKEADRKRVEDALEASPEYRAELERHRAVEEAAASSLQVPEVSREEWSGLWQRIADGIRNVLDAGSVPRPEGEFGSSRFAGALLAASFLFVAVLFPPLLEPVPSDAAPRSIPVGSVAVQAVPPSGHRTRADGVFVEYVKLPVDCSAILLRDGADAGIVIETSPSAFDG